jgi:hypothetical protein
MGFSSRTCGSNSSMASPVAGRTPKACRGRWQELRKDRSPAPTLFKSGGLVKNGDCAVVSWIWKAGKSTARGSCAAKGRRCAPAFLSELKLRPPEKLRRKMFARQIKDTAGDRYGEPKRAGGTPALRKPEVRLRIGLCRWKNGGVNLRRSKIGELFGPWA